MTQFHHVDSISQKNRLSSLEDNIKSFLDWSFLNIGAFVNIPISSPNSSLKPVSDPAQGTKIWESMNKDWIYENAHDNISYKSLSPIAFSGIYLNNTFLPSPSGSGNYTYRVNYPLGRITFNNNVSNSSNIKAAYSYRYIQTYKANENNWWKEVQKEIYGPPKNNNESSIVSVHKIQIPAVIIELTPRTILNPFQLGSTDNIITQDILLHVLCNNSSQRNNIIDILIEQKDNTLYLYDINLAVKNKHTPLDQYGSINDDGKNYNTLVSEYPTSWCLIKNTNISELNTISSSMHHGIVRWSIEIFPK